MLQRNHTLLLRRFLANFTDQPPCCSQLRGDGKWRLSSFITTVSVGKFLIYDQWEPSVSRNKTTGVTNNNNATPCTSTEMAIAFAVSWPAAFVDGFTVQPSSRNVKVHQAFEKQNSVLKRDVEIQLPSGND